VVIIEVSGMGNRAALNRLYRRQERLREAEWLANHLDELPVRDPAVVAAEDADIAARRAKFGLY
jgi:hypothetical protein